MFQETVKELFSFIESSPSVFHAVENMRQVLEEEGYARLLESRSWELMEGGKYYVIRNGSSIIAFRIPKRDFIRRSGP